MEAAPLVTLIAVFLAIAVIAAFLITVVFQLYQVYSRLNTVLGVVGEVIEKTAVLDPVISEIKGNLAAGQTAIEGSVDRLRLRKGDPDQAAGPERQEPVGIGTSAPTMPPSSEYRNY